MTLDTSHSVLLDQAIQILEQSFNELPEFKPKSDNHNYREILELVANCLQDNFPYAHPLYAGQMLKPPHTVARLAYSLAMFVNPNNHALDGGRASSQMEKEVMADIASMYGWGDKYLGHLTSSGTIANLEALWIADQIHPGKKVIASEQAHYTHSRLTQVLKIPYESVAVDDCGRMSIEALTQLLKTGEVGTVVVTMGTTGMGAVDPLHEIVALQSEYKFRIHIDSAYGGYFRLTNNLGQSATRAYQTMQSADSIVVDPHKCGLQPYGCGCVLFKDPGVGQYYHHDSPYTYFSSDELHLGEISLECSRAGASAVALWATMQMFPLEPSGQFARDIESTHEAANDFYQRLIRSDKDKVIIEPETNIVIWAPEGKSATEISRLSQLLFDRAAEAGLYLATIKLSSEWLSRHWSDVDFDEATVLCMRSCLMKAEHLDWLDQIWSIYSALRRG